jgi:hypothetical protein
LPKLSVSKKEFEEETPDERDFGARGRAPTPPMPLSSATRSVDRARRRGRFFASFIFRGTFVARRRREGRRRRRRNG